MRLKKDDLKASVLQKGTLRQSGSEDDLVVGRAFSALLNLT